MAPQSLCLAIIFINLLHILVGQDAKNCSSIYVTIEDFPGGTTDASNWNGVYSIDFNTKSFNASIWSIPNSNKWLKYIETHWVLSGQNNQLFIYQTNTLFPPTEQIVTWKHESDINTAQISLYCSTSVPPTNSPTSGPTTSPTYSPTESRCDVLIISDVTTPTVVSDTYFRDWHCYRLPNLDATGRPLWRYEDNINHIEAFVQFSESDGWVVLLNDGSSPKLYETGKLFGYYPPLDVAIDFNKTVNNAYPRTFKFKCLATAPPTNAPTGAPTPAPTLNPSTEPSKSPTKNPSPPPIPSPSSTPTMYPTVAPSINCDVLKINIPTSLINADNTGCNISFSAVFDAYWLKQIARSNRPSWTLDCMDNNADYTVACNKGYSGQVFFISNQWEIQVHSKKDDCFERFIVDNTSSYFVPTDSIWIDISTNNQYQFTMNCTEKTNLPSRNSTRASLTNTNTVYIYDQTWFWIAFVLILLICCLLCVGIWCYNKQKKDNEPNYEPQPVKSVSARVSQIQLQPAANFIDPNVAPNNNDDDDLKIDDPGVDGQERVTSVGSTASDPKNNPNLTPIIARGSTIGSTIGNRTNGGTSVVSDGGGDYKENGEELAISSDNSNGIDVEDMFGVVVKPETKTKDNDKDKNGDKALDLIAGKKQQSGYGVIDDNDDEQNDLLDETETTTKDAIRYDV